MVRELSYVWHLYRLTADGRSWNVVLESLAQAQSGALAQRTAPVAPTGGIALLRGSLAPRGAVIKRSAGSTQLLRHSGPALVFDGLADFSARIHDQELAVTPDSVLILRNVGPIGGPGMPEVTMSIPDKLFRAGVHDMVRISDGRMSGTARGTVVLHVAPEAAAGGPLVLVEDGDLVELDVDAGRLDLRVESSELARRALAHQINEEQTHPRRGYRWLYAAHVTQADEGCDFDFLAAAPRVAAITAATAKA